MLLIAELDQYLCVYVCVCVCDWMHGCLWSKEYLIWSRLSTWSTEPNHSYVRINHANQMCSCNENIQPNHYFNVYLLHPTALYCVFKCTDAYVHIHTYNLKVQVADVVNTTQILKQIISVQLHYTGVNITYTCTLEIYGRHKTGWKVQQMTDKILRARCVVSICGYNIHKK